jgi:hypothetical protein
MTISVRTRLDLKYLHPATIMVDPYTEERHGALYLVADGTAILCDSIVSIDSL